MTIDSDGASSRTDIAEQLTDAVILAGSRPGGDALADAHDVPVKALVRVAGSAMLAHVLNVLLANGRIGKLHVLAQNPAIFDLDSETVTLTGDDRVAMASSGATIATSIDDLAAGDDMRFPSLITTADNVLLSDGMIGHFLDEASGCDIAVAVVEHDVLMAKYPQSQRTWLTLRGGRYSGANLFYFGSSEARSILRYWAEVEQDRKKGWKLLTIFGPWLLLMALTRMLSIDALARRVGKKLDLDIRIVQMPQAEACIDVDKQDDLVQAEQIMAKRKSG